VEANQLTACLNIVRQLAADIRETQLLLEVEGRVDHPWTDEFCLRVVAVLDASLPPPVLVLARARIHWGEQSAG